MKKSVLITGGLTPPFSRICKIIKDAEQVVAADSGLDYALAHAVKPDMVVGDFDSLRTTEALNQLPAAKILRFDVDKDETDTEIGIRFLLDKGYQKITIIGGGGGRLDHLLGIVSLFFRPRRPSEWYTHRDYIVLIDKDFIGHGWQGRCVSFFPLTAKCRVKTSGLKWPLNRLKWRPGVASLSNQVSDSVFSIKVKTGRLLLLANLSADNDLNDIIGDGN